MTRFHVRDGRHLPIFLHSAVDDLGLDVYTFRIYARLARRAGQDDQAWESVPSMARGCRMSERKVHESLRALEGIGLVRRQQRTSDAGRSLPSLYVLQPLDAWRGRVHQVQGWVHTVQGEGAHGADKGTPLEGAPLKGRTSSPTGDTPSTPDDQTDGQQDSGTAQQISLVPSEGSSGAAATDLQRAGAAKGPQIPRADIRRVFDAYNDHRGTLPSARALTEPRARKISSLIRQLGGSVDEAVAVMGIGAAEVAQDDWWRSNSYGLDNLLAGMKVVQKAEAAASRGTVDRTDSERQRLRAALGGDA